MTLAWTDFPHRTFERLDCEQFVNDPGWCAVMFAFDGGIARVALRHLPPLRIDRWRVVGRFEVFTSARVVGDRSPRLTGELAKELARVRFKGPTVARCARVIGVRYTGRYRDPELALAACSALRAGSGEVSLTRVRCRSAIRSRVPREAVVNIKKHSDALDRLESDRPSSDR